MLLLGNRLEVADLSEIGIVFEAGVQVRAELPRQPGRGREIRLAILSEADIDDRVDDEFVLGVTEADDGTDLQRKPGLGEGRGFVAEFEIDAVEEIALFHARPNAQRSHRKRIGIYFL